MSSPLDINDNNFLRQFEVEIDGNLAKVEYALQERKIFLTKIIIPKNSGKYSHFPLYVFPSLVITIRLLSAFRIICFFNSDFH